MISTALLSSRRDDWCTPQIVIDLIRKIGPIGIDPCPCDKSIVHPAVQYPGTDGLALEWKSDGIVFVNPPYGRAIAPWIKRCHDMRRAYSGEFIALVPARTDTRWWHAYAVTAAAWCFWRGRLVFLGAQGPAPFPSALLYWGPEPGKFVATFRDHGWCINVH